MATLTSPRTVFEVRRDANANIGQRVLGYRMAQVEAFVRSRLEEGSDFPSLGELKRELDFYDKAGALRALRRLQQRGRIKNNP